MRIAGDQEVWSFVENGRGIRPVKKNSVVRGSSGYYVESYLDMATKVAELQFLNPDFVLMFRGQDFDFKNSQGNTTLKPSLFRVEEGSTALPSREVLHKRFETLRKAEAILVQQYSDARLKGWERLVRYRLLRWAILQHYEVCSTPLLDLTHSLRVAASFASKDQSCEAFLYVVAIPNLSGGITASAEAGLQVIRLASVCPPTAVRPHIQEGYLLGEYPDMPDIEQKGLYKHYEIDFGRRLITKFKFNPRIFWGNGVFPIVPREALYPSVDKDPLYKLALDVKQQIDW